MTPSRISVVTASVLLAVGLSACGPDEDDVPPQPTETPTLPSPAVPETAPPAGETSAPGGTIPAPAESSAGVEGAERAAPGAAAPAEGTAGPMSGADRAFAEKAMVSGAVEAEAGRMAAEKASDDKVKAFGEMLDKDHSAANTKLAQLAESKGIVLGGDEQRAERGKLDELAKLSGAEFDRSFLENFGTAKHEEAVALFERHAKEGQDPDLRAFAEETVAALRRHLETARELGQESR